MAVFEPMGDTTTLPLSSTPSGHRGNAPYRSAVDRERKRPDRSPLSACKIWSMSSPESDKSRVVGHTASPFNQ